jgi:O-acetyl-ADP-ribose deacetylase (regulator of RNase III)
MNMIYPYLEVLYTFCFMKFYCNCSCNSLVQVDVIVSTASEDLDLNMGAVSKAILMKAGPQIQADCKSQLRTLAPQTGKLKPGQIVVTGPHGLSCKHVFHGVCVQWDDGKGVSEKVSFW